MAIQTINITIKKCESLDELRHENGGRRIGQVYFQQIGIYYLIRTLTKETDPYWLTCEIELGNIHLPVENIKAEQS
jgi:hypothetical protein